MTSGRLLRQQIKVGARDGGEEFRRVAKEVIREERLKRKGIAAPCSS